MRPSLTTALATAGRRWPGVARRWTGGGDMSGRAAGHGLIGKTRFEARAVRERVRALG
jgi:hypothetical protein